jgi:hypothetical protein
MINQIIIYALFFVSILMQAMDDPRLQGPTDPNNALILAIASPVKGRFDKEALSHINNLIIMGADPNYVSPMFGVTPLMRAVRVNCPDLVELLLKKKAKVNVRNPDDKFVRDFNLIYSPRDVVPIVAAITNDMLNFERYNELNPPQKIHCRDTVYSMKQSQIIRNAVFIDKMLEDCKAYSDILPAQHPLMQMLRDPRVKRAMSYVFTHHWKDLPYALRYVLYGNKIPRATSAPGHFLTPSS